jgi:mannose-6-phosphate isomerase-like protein (cupin superfamily)
MKTNEIFNDFARAFEKKIDNDYFIKLQFEIYDMENEVWQIDVNNGNVYVNNEKRIVPEETFVLSKETLLKMYNNELSPLSAFSNEPNEKGEMCSLIELKDKTEDKKVYLSKKPSEETLKFLYRLHRFNEFFSKDYPTKIIIDNKNGVKAHSVNAIGLHSNYEKGILHVYFSIKMDESLYEPPIEFSLYVLSGRGTIIVGSERYDIRAKEYYHMIPKEKMYIENHEEELLELLYI